MVYWADTTGLMRGSMNLCHLVFTKCMVFHTYWQILVFTAGSGLLAIRTFMQPVHYATHWV